MSEHDQDRPQESAAHQDQPPDPREQTMQPDEDSPVAETEQDKQPPAKKGKKAKKEKQKKTVVQEILSWVWLLLAAVVLAGLIRGLIAEPVKVDGKSMLSTLNDKEVMLVTKPELLLGRLNRGDVIICRFPNRLQWDVKLQVAAPLDLRLTQHLLFVKRLVALPGDTVAVLEGRLYIDDQLVDEPYIDPERWGGSSFPRYTLKANEYFVLGDNRANSQDSRYYGPITRDMIVGHPKLVILPLSAIRVVK